MLEHVTVFPSDTRDSAARGISPKFPADLLGQAAGRIRVLALLYAGVFFLAGILPALLFPEDRARFLGSPVQWVPGVIGIVVALLVAAVVRSRRVPLPTAMNLGLVFEIASSYAIAAAEFADTMTLEAHQGFLGLSWVAVWVVVFTVVVPTSPRRAVVAALVSVSSVAVVIGLLIASGATSLRIAPAPFFFGLVFPYLVVVGMAYVAARVVYHLGTEVSRARELGSYRLEEKLGEGERMGEVWRARHRMLARPAAIKLIRPAFPGQPRAGVSAEAVRRFEREAQVIARLRSPDFGLVSAVRDPADPGPVDTQENAMPGTPAFMAPEQAAGTDFDGRADIYFDRLPGLLAPDRAVGVHQPDPLRTSLSHAHMPPTPPSGPGRAADPGCARRPGARLPGQGPRAATAVGEGAVASAGRGGRRERLDPGAGAGVVGDALGGSPAGAPAGSGAVACRLRGRFARAHAV